MIVLRLKGGIGSGFHGHKGRPGLEGGSTARGVLSSDIASKRLRIVDTQYMREVDAVPLPTDDNDPEAYIILSDGRVLESLQYGHDGLCYDLLDLNMYDLADGNQELMNELDKMGGLGRMNWLIQNTDCVRIDQTPRETNFQTKSFDIATLRRLQKFSDYGKITLAPRIVWDGGKTESDARYRIITSYEEFMSAKYVITQPDGNVSLKEFRFKGGIGSGFFGHKGRSGEVGGSLPKGASAIGLLPDVPIKLPQNDSTIVTVPTANYNTHGTSSYFILPDDSIILCRAGHFYAAMSIVDENDIDSTGVGNADIYKLLGKGFIRVLQTFLETNIETSNIDKPTLRRLQQFVDDGKLELRKNVVWSSYINGFGGRMKPIPSTDFMMAKFVVPEGSDVVLKGGAGSGFHGHKGIPGHQGGSLPKGVLSSQSSASLDSSDTFKYGKAIYTDGKFLRLPAGHHNSHTQIMARMVLDDPSKYDKDIVDKAQTLFDVGSEEDSSFENMMWKYNEDNLKVEVDFMGDLTVITLKSAYIPKVFKTIQRAIMSGRIEVAKAKHIYIHCSDTFVHASIPYDTIDTIAGITVDDHGNANILMKELVLKGGAGSGFHGHKGRNGEVGGSVARGVLSADVQKKSELILPENSSYFSIVKGTRVIGKHNWDSYFITPDDKVLLCKDGHFDAAHSILELNNIEVTNKSKDEITFIVTNYDYIRVLAQRGMTVIHTSKFDSSTLRRLQRLIDSDKLDVKDYISWYASTDLGAPSRGVNASYEEFMSAKYAVLSADAAYGATLKDIVLKGGLGSGFVGHKGRKGLIGGSVARGALSQTVVTVHTDKSPSADGIKNPFAKPPLDWGRYVNENIDKTAAYVASWGKDEDAKQSDYHPESQVHMWIDPEDYFYPLSKVPENAIRAWSENNGVAYRERIDALKDRMKKRLPMDAVWYDVDVATGKVFNQEGRHRAIAAHELGIGKIPLIIYFRDVFGKTVNIKDYDKQVLLEKNPFWNYIKNDYHGVSFTEVTKEFTRLKGGIGSGFHGHKGRIGEVGGSVARGILSSQIDQNLIRQANSTSRNSGAVGAKAIVPKYVETIAKPSDTILDFGAGKAAAHTLRLRNSGLNVEAYEFGNNSIPGLHNPFALLDKYSIVYASNVLNVQGSDDMLQNTLQQLSDVLEDKGRLIVNLPVTPRYGAWDGLSPKQAVDKLYNLLSTRFTIVTRVGGTSSAPLFEAHN